MRLEMFRAIESLTEAALIARTLGLGMASDEELEQHLGCVPSPEDIFRTARALNWAVDRRLAGLEYIFPSLMM